MFFNELFLSPACPTCIRLHIKNVNLDIAWLQMVKSQVFLKENWHTLGNASVLDFDCLLLWHRTTLHFACIKLSVSVFVYGAQGLRRCPAMVRRNAQHMWILSSKKWEFQWFQQLWAFGGSHNRDHSISPCYPVTSEVLHRIQVGRRIGIECGCSDHEDLLWSKPTKKRWTWRFIDGKLDPQ